MRLNESDILSDKLAKFLQQVSPCGKWALYGSKRPKIVIVGHSHTFAMLSAFENRKDLSKRFAVISQADMSKHIPVDQSYWNYANSLSKKSRLAIAWNGNQHNILFLLDEKLRFKAQGLNEEFDFPAVSISRLEKLFEPTFTELSIAIDDFEDKSRLLFLGTPAPKPKFFLDGLIRNDDFFTQIAKEKNLRIEELEVTHDEIRVYMWLLTQKLLESRAGSIGASFIPTPHDSYDSNFILVENYWSQDLTHANDLYGALMLDEIIHWMDL